MDSNNQDAHNSKFEAALRPACSITDCSPVVLLNPVLSEATRTKEQVLSAYRRGRALEAQTTPTSNGCITVSMTFIQPPALPGMPSLPSMPSMPPEMPSLPGVPSLPGMPSLPKIPSMPPATATLWGFFQQQPKLPSPSQFGANSALSVLGDGFNGFNTEGYVDVNKNLGLEYSLSACPAGTVSGDLELEAIMPRAAPFLAPVSIKHKMAVQQAGVGAIIDHSTKLSMPVASGKGAAYVHIRPHIHGPLVSLEVASKGRSGTGNSTRNQPAAMVQQNLEAESDGEDTAQQFTTVSGIPSIKLELPPGGLPFFSTARTRTIPGRGGVALRWRQAWSSTVRTTAAYSSSSNKVQVDAHARVQPALHLAGGVSVDVGGEGKGPGVGQAVAKVIWRGIRSGFGKHAVHLESRYSNAGGLMHVVKLRHRPMTADGNFGAEADLSMKFRPQSATPSLQFDLFLPI